MVEAIKTPVDQEDLAVAETAAVTAAEEVVLHKREPVVEVQVMTVTQVVEVRPGGREL